MRSFIAIAATAAVAACGTEQDSASLGLRQDALIRTLGFDDGPSGTAVDVRYPGVSFKEELTGGHVYAVALGAEPGNVVSIWSPLNRAGVYSSAFAAEEGAVRVTFSKLQRSVSVRARLLFPAEYLTAPKRPYLQAFDAQGNYLATAYYNPAAGCAGAACEWQTLAITRATAEIKSTLLSSQNNFAGLTGCLVPDAACSASGASGCPNRVHGGFYGQFDDLTFDDGGAALAAAYRGCYTDDANRALPVRLIDSGATVESCVATAAARGFPYAALQWYGQCWAGYALGYVKTADSECNTPCSANAGETCGGSWRSSVYQTPAAARLPAASAYQGCFVDSSVRALAGQLFTSGATVESCTAAAAARGFAYAGLQAGGQCFAGNALAYGKTAECECNATCSTARGEICGGAWRNSVYATGAAAAALPPVASLYKGCYSDDANRALPAQLIAKGATVQTCIAAAKAMGYRYAGLQWHGVCYAGNTLAYQAVAGSNCNTPCDAAPGETCGGAWFNSVYATP